MTEFNKLASLMAVDDDTDKVIETLGAARSVLLSSAKMLADDALVTSASAVEDAMDGALAIIVFDDVLTVRKLRDQANDCLQQAFSLTSLLCAAQATGDDETDDAFMGIEQANMGTDAIYAALEVAENNVETIIELMPDSTAPGARCVSLDELDGTDD